MEKICQSRRAEELAILGGRVINRIISARIAPVLLRSRRAVRCMELYSFKIFLCSSNAR
jgi:hypothetical protein